MYLSFLGYNTLHIHSKGACGWRALLLRLCNLFERHSEITEAV